MPVSPLDESGNPVDWWFIYKVPKLDAGAGGDSASGYEYAYFDAQMDKDGKSVFSPSIGNPKKKLGDGQSALDRTLNAIFHGSGGGDIGYVIYNDEYPVAVGLPDDANLGHTKGVLAFAADNTALWLLHSWPKYADPKAKEDPTPMYGQTYLCLSLDVAAAEAIAKLMLNFHEPQTYDARPCSAVSPARTPSLAALLNSPKYAGVVPGATSIDLKTRGTSSTTPMSFKVIAKNKEWDQDFWNGLVGPTLGEDMDVDTWIRGPVAPLADTDGIHKTFDIKYINLGALGIHYAWPEAQDHAKWGITLKSDWVCVGDINRMVSQRKRGGGAIAFQNRTLWTALTKTSLLLAPPGHTRTAARAIVHATHPTTKAKPGP